MKRAIPTLMIVLSSAFALAGGTWGSASGQWCVGWGVAAAGLCLLAAWGPFPHRASPLLPQPKSGAGLAGQSPAMLALAEAETPGDLATEMIGAGRYALLLRPQIAAELSPRQLHLAWESLDAAMAMVPAGPVMMRSQLHEEMADDQRVKAETRVQVEAYYLDRYPVTNGDFERFVAAGGYEQLSLWEEVIWPAMLQFTDRTGQPGPRGWENGRCPADQADHPVAGICWWEAAAFARWAGKRLPTDPEWVKAGCWPVCSGGAEPLQRRFPWGDAMDRRFANVWGSGSNGTAPITDYAGGASVGGVQQLIGNVWEWTNAPFGAWEPAALRLETAAPMKSIRGGAFDTYFESQATCHFQSGEFPLARKQNIGFRCAIGCDDLVPACGGAVEAAEDSSAGGAACADSALGASA